MISKIIDYLTWQRGSGSTEGDSSDASSKSSEGRVPYYEYLKALKEEEEVGTPINEFAKVQLEVFDIIDQNNRYHTRIRSNLRTKEADEISAWELYRDTENLGDNLWRAYDLDYKRFTRGHSLLQDFLHEYGDTDRLPQEVILGIEQQASVFEVYREWAMVESWKCSVLHNG